MKVLATFVIMACSLYCLAFSKTQEEVCEKASKVMITESCSDDGAVQQKARDCLKNIPSGVEKVFMEVTGSGDVNEGFDKICNRNELVAEMHDTVKAEGLEVKEEDEKYIALKGCLEEFDD